MEIMELRFLTKTSPDYGVDGANRDRFDICKANQTKKELIYDECNQRRATIRRIVEFDSNIKSPDILSKYIEYLEDFNCKSRDAVRNRNDRNERAQLLSMLYLDIANGGYLKQNELAEIIERSLFLISGLLHEKRLDTPGKK